MARLSFILSVVVVVVVLIYTAKRPASEPVPPETLANATNSQHVATGSKATLINAEDPEFVQRVVPNIRKFFATLDQAGVNPPNTDLPFSNVRMRHGPHAMYCLFLIGDVWSATFVETPKFSGITHFGQRGPDNPFGAISHANTNALRRIAQGAIKMPQAEAERILGRIADAFGIDRSKYEKPEIYPEQMFEYDLGLWTVRYRKKGSDPINELNYTRRFTIKATSPTTALLVDYSHLSSME